MQPLTARLVPFSIRGGRENMAADEYLLARHGPGKTAALRLYGWRPAAITLGRYQGLECLDIDACRADGVDIVRRITGGGAIFHDRELTYSVVWPDDDAAARGCVDRSFERINAFILETYRSMGLDPAYAMRRVPGRTPSGRAQFCFSGSETYDILLNGKKIGGNAQRRLRGAVLQHGSIPLAIDAGRVQRYFRDSIDTRTFTSLGEACGRDITAEELIGPITGAFMKAMNVTLAEEQLDEAEEADIRNILLGRHAAGRCDYYMNTESSLTRETGLA